VSTGLAVVRMVGASVAHSSYTVAHAGRRKVVIAGGGEMTHHTNMLDDARDAVNDPPRPRVAFQGALGAFSELAIREHWGNDAVAVPAERFEDAIACVAEGQADYAVIPVENAIAGPVHAALGALDAAAANCERIGEVRINVRLCLMAPRGATLEGLRMVHSHPMALAQCRIFFARHGWLTPVLHADTAGAARDVAKANDVSVGAVAGAPAAERYGLVILATSIEDVPGNWTNFRIIARR
jgi:prephenate dehydratase